MLVLLGVVLVLLVASVALLVYLVPKDENPAVNVVRTEDPIPPESGPTDKPRPRTTCRMLVDPDYSFAKLVDKVSTLGMRPIEPVTDDEPDEVTWKNQKFTLRYHYNSRVGLRALEISGYTQAKYLRNDLVNVCCVPSLDGHKVCDYLRSSEPELCMLAIYAAEWLGVGPDHRYYLEGVADLRSHRDPEVAVEAERVHVWLQSQAQAGRS
jgi:hypothetical protein